MNKLLEVVGAAVLIVLGVCLVAIVGAYPFKWCWNYVIPSLFGLRQIGALEGFCLVWVSTSLFTRSCTHNKE